MADVPTFDKRCADALADEVAVLIRRKVIDARSPAGDALLDYREPPSSPRADRLAELEVKLAERDRELAQIKDKLEQRAFSPLTQADADLAAAKEGFDRLNRMLTNLWNFMVLENLIDEKTAEEAAPASDYESRGRLNIVEVAKRVMLLLKAELLSRG